MQWWFYKILSGWITKTFWHSPELDSLLYSLYKILLTQAFFHSPYRIFARIVEQASASFPACSL